MPQPAPGMKVTDRVTLVKPLSEGAMGSVWVAKHSGLQTEVAVKFLSSDGSQTRERALKRFAVEASAAAQIQSPHVVRIFDHGVTDDGTAYIVMERLQGTSLEDRLQTGGPLSLAEMAAVVRQAARALDAAHALGVVHRDIKPGNIFLTEAHGETLVKVLDFGVAKHTRAADGTGITEPGMIVGTPGYLCRDVLIARTSLADPQVDRWALAVVVYRGLTGELPFQGKNLQQVCVAILAASPPKASKLRRELPPAVDAFFARAFAEDPAKRFASAQALADALGAIAGEDKPRRGGTRWAAVALLLVAIALGGALYLRPPAPFAPPGSASATTSAATAATAPAADSAPAPAPRPSVPLPPPTPATLLEPRAGEILVPPGEVVFGCAAHEKCPEQQRGRATYVEPFFLDRLEVTVLDYGKCVLDGACSDRRLQSANETADPRILSSDCNWHQARHERHALNCLSYAQAESYCRHKGSRLPTEAEWMRAARGDDGRAFPWGEERVSCERAVMKDGDGAGCGRHNSWQAGQKREDLSPFGVLDLAGNMREWVSDWYDPGYFAEAPQDNPPGPKSGRLRVIKGGSWGDHDPAELRVVARRGMDPTERSIYVGFRCARSAVAQ